jgi:hypothetical protein
MLLSLPSWCGCIPTIDRNKVHVHSLPASAKTLQPYATARRVRLSQSCLRCEWVFRDIHHALPR